MGNNKNSRGSHASRGKYAKKKVPREKKDKTAEDKCDGSRIINLNKLNEHLQEISHHAATCRSCSDNALSLFHPHFSVCWLFTGIPVCNIIKSSRHNWRSLLGVQSGCSVGADGYRGRTCTTHRIYGYTGHTFFDEKVFYGH